MNMTKVEIGTNKTYINKETGYVLAWAHGEDYLKEHDYSTVILTELKTGDLITGFSICNKKHLKSINEMIKGLGFELVEPQPSFTVNDLQVNDVIIHNNYKIGIIVNIEEEKEISWIAGYGDSTHKKVLENISKVYRPKHRGDLGNMIAGKFEHYTPIWEKESE